MTELTVILKAFAEDTRLRILRLISAQELSVSELVDVLQVPQSRISRHLGVLRQAGLAHDRRDGNWIYYNVSIDGLDPVCRSIWEGISPRLNNGEFFPEDLQRLEGILTGRKARTRAYFDAVVSEWDRIKQDYIQDVLPFLMVGELIRSDAAAVDVGTGTGEVLLALAPKAGKVIGVDSSKKMLEACRRRVVESGVKNVELREGDAEALPLADEECDITFISMVLHHLGRPARGVREMARVVKPGGRVVIIDLVKHEHDWAREVMADVWLGFTEQQITQWLVQAGLLDVNYSVSAIRSPLDRDSSEKLQTFIAVATKPQKD